MTRRVVRFSGFFFDRLDDLLGDSRGDDGSPSTTDFLVYDLPPVCDLLAEDFEGQTMPFPVDSTDIRAYVGSGVLVSRFALIMTLCADGTVEVLDVELG
jgi:hypothetical protein